MSWWPFWKPKPKPPTTCGIAVIAHEGSNSGPVVPGLLVTVTGPGTSLTGTTNRDGYVAFGVVPKGVALTLSVGGHGWQPYRGIYTFQAQNQDVPISLTRDVPIAPVAPRAYDGNLCGIRLDGLPVVDGMPDVQDPADPRYGLVLSWFYDRYGEATRARIRQAWKARGYVDVALSWPDSRAVGKTPDQFVAICRELVADGFRPTAFLLSKDTDPHDDEAGLRACIEQVLDTLLAPRAVSRISLGWELSLFMSPQILQALIDTTYARCVAADVKLLVHFQEGYFAFQVDGGVTADFWRANVGKLWGILHQKPQSWGEGEYKARIVDCLERFAGGYGCPADNGFGEPFEFIAWEITAMSQYDGSMPEHEGDRLGSVALSVPPVNGVGVIGSGNGHL